MYGEGYARFRTQPPPQGGGAPAPLSGGGGRPRGPPTSSMMRSNGDADIGVSDIAPEDLARSLQSVAASRGGGFPPGRQAGFPRGGGGRMMMTMSAEQLRGGPPLMSRGGGGPTRTANDQWMQRGGGGGGDYDPNGYEYAMQTNTGGEGTPPAMNGSVPQGMIGRVPPATNRFLPAVKYRRVNGDEDLRMPPGSSGGGGGGGPTPLQGGGVYRMQMNNYDTIDPNGLFQGGSPPLANARVPQPSRGGGGGGGGRFYPPRTGGVSPQELMVMRQRRQAMEEMEQDPRQVMQRGPPMAQRASPSWGKAEENSAEHARWIHRVLQPPPQSSWPIPSPSMAAHMRAPPSGNDDSPGSRIVTPASALHNNYRRSVVGGAGPRGPLTAPPRGPPQYEAYESMPLPGMPRSQPARPNRLPGYEQPHDQYAMPETKTAFQRRAPAEEYSDRYAPAAPPPPPTARQPPAARKSRKASAKSTASKRSASEALASTPSTVASTKAKAASAAAASDQAEPKRRCGRKSMNYSSEQKRERNRAAVKKCRQRQALKYEYLKRKAEVLASENRALSEMLVKNVELDDEKRNSLTRGIQMDILLKIKEIFTQSLPKDFVLDADSIWDLNSVLAVSMPSRCYYGIESIKDFWRTSLRMRNKGKIRSFWAWLFRLPPGDRFAEFTIEPFAPTSNLYFIRWTTKSTPALSGSIVIMFGHGHRVTLHVEVFGWLIWRYLLTNTPFPEPPLE